jgi:hypothetical protein
MKEQFYRDPAQVAHRINTLKLMKANFIVKQSNYTTTIIFPTGAKEMYLQNLRSLDVFKANKVIAREAVPNYIEADFEERLEYYGINSDKFLEVRQDKPAIYNIDLSAAYPTALKNFGLISEKTFKYLMRLDKLDRLACIGMFASRKTVYTIKHGEFMNVETEESEHKNIFYLPAYVTDEIMKNCRLTIGEPDFLFYWFDGVYFTGKRHFKQLEEHLNDVFKMPFKFQKLSKFKAQDTGNTIKLEFWEPKKGFKQFALPKKQTLVNINQMIHDSVVK